MNRRYVLAPQALRDLVDIWDYVRNQSSRHTASRVESVIRGKFPYLADLAGAGHLRRDLACAEVCFFPVYS
jgi:plasmid stabilization system protein ParE